jgi:hypothetical protein
MNVQSVGQSLNRMETELQPQPSIFFAMIRAMSVKKELRRALPNWAERLLAE